MTWKLAEAPAVNLRAYILANQATKMAAVQARAEYVATPITLPVFADVKLHAPLVGEDPEYPMLYIRPIGGRMRLGVGGLAQSSPVVSMQYMVVVVCEDAEGPETALLKGMRYLVAVLEMMAESYDGTTYPYHWGMDREVQFDYSPLYTMRTDLYFADVRVLVSTQVSEGAL